MKVVRTDAALADLDDILANTAANYPTLVNSLEQRVRAVAGRLSGWPESARNVEERPGVRTVPLIRYPYRLFYRADPDHVVILHIHHAARAVWEGEPDGDGG